LKILANVPEKSGLVYLFSEVWRWLFVELIPLPLQKQSVFPAEKREY